MSKAAVNLFGPSNFLMHSIPYLCCVAEMLAEGAGIRYIDYTDDWRINLVAVRQYERRLLAGDCAGNALSRDTTNKPSAGYAIARKYIVFTLKACNIKAALAPVGRGYFYRKRRFKPRGTCF